MTLVNGLNLPDVAVTLLRIAMGCYFVLAGCHKLFGAQHQIRIAVSMRRGYVPDRFGSWIMPLAQYVFGVALVIGSFATVAATALLMMSVVSTIRNRLPFEPSWFEDIVCLPEVLYAVILLSIVLTGAGPYSVDALIWDWDFR